MTNRVTSLMAGAALSALGYRRSNRGLGLLGLGLIARGTSGWCPVTAAVDHEGAYYGEESSKRHLRGSRGVIVEDVITIYRPVSEVYSFWRNLENLPRFMEHLEEVRVVDRYHSHWVARGPLGVLVEWDAEIINDIPPTLLSWKSIGAPDVASAGSVRFKPSGEHATQVHIKLQYDPPAGKLGATVAWLFSEDPQHQIAEDLRRFKQIIETGEAADSEQYPASDAADFGADLGSLR